MTVRHIPGFGLINTAHLLRLTDIRRFIDNSGLPHASFCWWATGYSGTIGSYQTDLGISVQQVEQTHRDLTAAMMAENEKPYHLRRIRNASPSGRREAAARMTFLDAAMLGENKS